MTLCDEETERQILATAAGLGNITLCPCGTISLNVGGVSVRMELTAFAQTAEMCRTAILALDGQARALQALGLKKQSLMTH
jgi:hypothetical protein